jgi:hypothetical protein
MSMLSSFINAIYSFVGGKMSLEQLGTELDAKAAAAPEKLDWRNSIVDLMKLTGQDSSLANRETLARELGYQGPFDGSAAMNIWLHAKVMEGLR